MNTAPARRSRRAVLALALAAPFVARAAQSLADALGRNISLKTPAQRIMLGFNYEEFTAVAGVEGWQRVVGYSRAPWADWRPSAFTRYSAAIPRIAQLADVGLTDDSTFSMEKVLSLRPDLVILPEWAYTALGQQIGVLEAQGIPVAVIDYNAEIPERHLASTRLLGAVTGNTDRGEELARLYASSLAGVRRRTTAAGTKPRVYLEMSQGGPGVTGVTYTNSMWGRLFTMIGADNIATGKITGSRGELSPEYVLSADPQAIFIVGSSWPNRPLAVPTGFDADISVTRARLAPYAKRPGWNRLSAIRDGQLFAVEHGLCRTLYDYTAAQFLAKAIYPAQFKGIDPEAELRRFHERYLPVKFEGTWMARLEPVPQ